MTAYELPTSLNIGGVDYRIRTDFRAILDILISQNDPDLDDRCKSIVLIQILFEDWEQIPPDCIEEALKKGCDFIDCGQEDDGKPKPQMIDWEQDARIIIPAVNKIAHTEVRAVPYMHWWTFFSFFMEVGESLLSNVLSIRKKKTERKKLDKWEQDFYRENHEIIDIKKKISQEEQEQKDRMLKWL